MILATLELIKTALTNFATASHFVLLSGADYPIKSDFEIERVFRVRTNHNFIKLYDMMNDSVSFWRHLNQYHLHELLGGRSQSRLARVARRSLEGIMRPFKKQWPQNLNAAAGSQWWALTPACCQSILNTISADRFWQSYWRYSFAPDEIFFHTLVANSEFLSLSDGYIDSPFQDATAPLHLVDRDLSKVFGIADLPAIGSSEKLFVRKVSTARSTELLDALDDAAKNHRGRLIT